MAYYLINITYRDGYMMIRRGESSTEAYAYSTNELHTEENKGNRVIYND